jgi:hypothetical protein
MVALFCVLAAGPAALPLLLYAQAGDANHRSAVTPHAVTKRVPRSTREARLDRRPGTWRLRGHSLLGINGCHQLVPHDDCPIRVGSGRHFLPMPRAPTTAPLGS